MKKILLILCIAFSCSCLISCTSTEQKNNTQENVCHLDDPNSACN